MKNQAMFDWTKPFTSIRCSKY